jgi:hypothetical protein
MHREDTHHLESALVEVMRKGEAVVPSELDPDEDLARRGSARDRRDVLDGRLEPVAVRREREGARVGLPAPAHDECVPELAGIDTDDGCGLLGPGALEVLSLVGLHGALPSQVATRALQREGWEGNTRVCVIRTSPRSCKPTEVGVSRARMADSSTASGNLHRPCVWR